MLVSTARFACQLPVIHSTTVTMQACLTQYFYISGDITCSVLLCVYVLNTVRTYTVWLIHLQVGFVLAFYGTTPRTISHSIDKARKVGTGQGHGNAHVTFHKVLLGVVY